VKLALLTLLATGFACGTAYTSSVTGNASSSATWGGAGVPGNGDTVTIATATTVTVNVNTTWGASGANGTTAVTLQGSGQLIVATGIFFTIRGNLTDTHGQGGTPLVIMNPGSTWQFDSSAASAPSTTKYEFTGVLGDYVFLQANCTAIARCSVQSNAGGGAGYFDATTNSQSGGIIAAYTDFLRIDHFAPAFQSTGGGSSVPWNVTDSTFNYCGIISSNYTAGTGTVFIHNNNVHTNTVGGFIFYSPFSVGLSGGGARQLENNVFDALWGQNVSSNTWVPDNFTMTGNYFGQCVAPNPVSGIWTQFQYNLVRATTGCFLASGDVLDNYVIEDLYSAVHDHNPDTSTQPLTPSFLRNIFDNTFFTFAGNTIDGIILDEGAPGAQTSATVKYNIVLPAGNGVGGQQTFEVWGPNTATLDIEHNTSVASIAGGCYQMEYENANVPNGVAQRGILSNNVCVALAPQANTVPFLEANIENPITDLFLPASIQNNVRFNLRATGGVSGSTNEGNGYWGAWSVTPGASDILADPQFVDPTRNVATFDSAYLHNVASATWASESWGNTFNVGEIISDQNSSYYGSALINYRAIASHVKGNPNAEPGVGSAWHTYWEFSSLNSIRNAVAAGATITDASIGASGASYIIALTDWVRAGFAPQNVLLHNTATDGTDIGAAPYTPPTLAGCNFSMTPLDISFGAGAGTGSLTMTTAIGCNWQAVSNDAWLTITAGSSGTGIGTINFNIDANAGPSQRLGNLSVGGLTFAVTQATAPVSVPTLISPAIGAAGVSLMSTLSWSTSSGATSYDVYFGMSPTPSLVTNTTATSYTPATLTSNTTYYWQVIAKNSAGSTPSAIFSFTTFNSSCSFAATPPAVLIAFAGGSATVSVTAGTSCAWTATSNASWLTITAGSSGTGNGSISFTATSNAGIAQLVYISFANQRVGVVQGGPPSVQIFNDVPPSDPYFDYVSLMSSYGITAGCEASPPLYCPSSPVTRAQMAVFVMRGLEIATGAALSYPPTAYFQDVPTSGVPDSIYFPYVQAIAQLGITAGCQTSPPLYCPDQSITQGQMAVFMITGWMLANNLTTFSYPTTPYFTDVPSTDPFFKFVQKMAQLGFWTGCGGGSYCESSAVTRDQMAPMIMRAMIGAP